MRTESLITIIGCGGLLILLGVPLLLEKVPPNGLYGVRIRATFTDPAIWYEVNRVAGRDFVVVGSLTVGLAIVFETWGGLRDVVGTLGCIGFLTLGAVFVAIKSVLLANRRQRERRAALERDSNERGEMRGLREQLRPRHAGRHLLRDRL